MSGAGAMSGGLPGGISLTGSGGLDVAGLEWLGARAYDPAARGFLSIDPLAPVLGAGWDGNPYAYAGNDPLNASDPTGLRPLTDEDLKAYDAANRGALAAAGDWVKDNWEYIVGGVAIIGGAALMFVPGGQIFGAGLISFGADVVIQKATTGEVNWTQAGINGGLGMLGFGAGAAVGRAFNNPLVREAMTNGVEGAVSGAGGYFTGPAPHTPTGFFKAAATGAGAGALPIPNLIRVVGQKIENKLMAAVTARPDAGTMAMGRSMEYLVVPYADANGMGYYKALPDKFYDFTQDYLPNSHERIHLWANKKWIDYQMKQGKSLVDIGAPMGPAVRGIPTDPSPYYDMD
ncbi:hypothetical protein GD627_09470 [Arthrobacter yangruifuii]|uniref:RHS repeat-associated core domain-containing protein n=1 Tax=Arthrobacter yangruifuii TaxID=2606616 RepID=A0A5N6MHR4_9MICC|nr:RHS repeat-associated core domain-containing protein [Arthrobacter yangruifuii]KAD3633062.1 hypothetical protein GD627_09470 [Arthrobacter yangruifuii]